MLPRAAGRPSRKYRIRGAYQWDEVTSMRKYHSSYDQLQTRCAGRRIPLGNKMINTKTRKIKNITFLGLIAQSLVRYSTKKYLDVVHLTSCELANQLGLGVLRSKYIDASYAWLLF